MKNLIDVILILATLAMVSAIVWSIESDKKIGDVDSKINITVNRDTIVSLKLGAEKEHSIEKEKSANNIGRIYPYPNGHSYKIIGYDEVRNQYQIVDVDGSTPRNVELRIPAPEVNEILKKKDVSFSREQQLKKEQEEWENSW